MAELIDFIGRYDHTLDAKNRLMVPQSFRDSVNTYYDGRAAAIAEELANLPPASDQSAQAARAREYAERLHDLEIVRNADVLACREVPVVASISVAEGTGFPDPPSSRETTGVLPLTLGRLKERLR